MKKSISIHGISTASQYQEGDCIELVNARRKNGVIQPVTPRKTVRRLGSVHELLFLHKNAGYEHLIGVRAGGLYHIIGEAGPDYGEIQIMAVSGEVSITQTGNVLNVLDDSGLKYALWYEDEYKVIDTRFDGEQTDNPLLPEGIIDFKVDGITGENNVRIIRQYKKGFAYPNKDQSSPENIQVRKDYAHGAITKAVSIETSNGRLTGYFLACTALELYDGTYILQSRPVLLGAAYDGQLRYNWVQDGTVVHYRTNPAVFACNDLGGVVSEEGYTTHEKLDMQIAAQGEVITGAIGARTTSYPYVFSYYLRWGESEQSNPLLTNISSNTLKFRLNSSMSENYKPLIKSISVFITPQSQLYDYTKWDDTQATMVYMGNNIMECFTGAVRSFAEITEELASQQFYKVHEIPFSDINSHTGEWISVDLKGKLGDVLYTREVLPLDTSRSTVIPEEQYVYNSRLHVMNYKTLLPRSFPLDYFYPQSGKGQATGEVEALDWRSWWISVEIDTGKGLSKTVRYREYSSHYMAPYFLMPFISFPDSRAKKMTIYCLDDLYLSGDDFKVRKKEFTLKASEHYNFAYYVADDLWPIQLEQTGDPYPPVPAEENREEVYENGLKVSEVNNPFYFPIVNTYVAGSGRILNAAANVMNVSDRNFGTYPLYVATTQGFFMMNTGSGEVVYTHVSPASSTLVPVQKILCATPYGLAFVGLRGIFIINGQETTCITLPIEQAPQSVTLAGRAVGSVPFLDYLHTVSHLIYNPHENELLIINSTYDFNFVYSFDTREVYQSTEKISYEVGNTYPNLLVADKTIASTQIKDYSQPRVPTGAVRFLLRPLSFGVDEVKKMQRSIIRGRFYNLRAEVPAGDAYLALYGSNDGVNFVLLRGYTMKDSGQGKDYKDFDLGLMARANFRSFIVEMQVTVDEKTEIHPIDFEVSDRYNNDKMR